MIVMILKSLRYYWRTHLAVMIGVFLAATVLTGALFVGDSVKGSLQRLVDERSGPVQYAMLGNDRFFSADLAAAVAETAKTQALPLLQVQGTVNDVGESTRVNAVNVIGVPEEFWALGEHEAPVHLDSSRMILNEALAARLGVEIGDTLIARVELPGAISRDAPLSGESNAVVSLRVEVQQIVDVHGFGNYSLKSEQVAPMNLFVPLADLGKALEKEGRANVVLFVGEDPVAPIALQDAIDEVWDANDTDLVVQQREGQWELVSNRVLLDWGAESIAQELQPGSQGVFTYLITSIDAKEKSVPYSMVTAVASSPSADPLPTDFPDDGIMINQWLADQLGIGVGEELSLSYNVFSTGRKLVERQASFTVQDILPMTHSSQHARWTPDFPGISEADNCRDWEPGIPVDLNKIRDVDEDYWDDYKGTPKAFITLTAGQTLWSNRFGQLTSIRFGVDLDEADFKQELDAALKPRQFGVQTLPIADYGQRAVANSLEFGMYLSFFSYFIIVAAIILTILLFALSIDQREPQIGVLRAIGFPPEKVRRMILFEGSVVALIGSLLGALGGIAYTKGMIAALSSVWKDAIGGLQISFSPSLTSVFSGAYGVLFIAFIAMFFATRRVAKRKPVELMSGHTDADLNAMEGKPLFRCKGFWALLTGGLMAVMSIAAGMGDLTAEVQAGAFAGAGFFLLIAGVGFASLLLGRSRKWLANLHSLGALGVRNSGRKRGRSLAVIVIMAAGVFMICVTNAFRLDATETSEVRSSGTGGFRFIGESSLALYDDLNTQEAREKFALDDEELVYSMVAFRVRQGEEASCLNLNQAQRPRLMAVDPQGLIDRESFTFQAKSTDVEGSPWALLNTPLDDGAIPGVMDFNSATYAMKLKLGDDIAYQNEQGQTVKVRIVGLLKGSVLQGSVIIGNEQFEKAYSSAGGFRYFLIDTPTENAKDVSASLTRMLGDKGFALTETTERLNAFNNVQNTYLHMISTLGGLGLLLGTAGLAVVTFRNILERRREMALMEALGFDRKRVSWLVLSEHWFLHLAAVILGVACAVLAVYPALTRSGQSLPIGLLSALITAIFFGGLLFCWWAARSVLKQPLLESLRHE